MRISDWSSDVCSSDLGDDRVTIQAVVARAAGALPGAEVTYLSQPVGRVEESEFVDEGILVTMSVDLPHRVESQLPADVRQQSALGEPSVDRSEESREGEEGVSTCRYRWGPINE